LSTGGEGSTEREVVMDLKLMRPMGTGQGYLKAGFLGFQGSGKTYTATLLAVLTRQHFKLKGPIAFFDTEAGSEYVAPTVKKLTGQDLIGVRSRSFGDLVATAREAEREGASVLIADSMTHVWRELCDAYLNEVNEARQRNKQSKRQRLEFQDWGIIKGTWAEWTDFYLNSKLHIIICGRAGYDYDFEENEETHRKELIKTGVKMKTEGEFGFEPSLLVEMIMQQNLPQGRRRSAAKPKAGVSVSRLAIVIKDRFSVIDGAETVFTTQGGAKKLDSELAAVLRFFKPHLDLLVPGAHAPVDTEIKTQTGVDETGDAQFYRDRRERVILCEEVQGEILKLYPGQTGAEKKAKADLLDEVFRTRSWTKVETLISLPDLRAGLESIRRKAEAAGTAANLERVTTLAAQLAEVGVSAEGIIDLYERAGGVREPQHLDQGDINKLVALMEDELAARRPAQAKPGKGNGRKKAAAAAATEKPAEESSDAAPPPPEDAAEPRDALFE
jgi:AAA domain